MMTGQIQRGLRRCEGEEGSLGWGMPKLRAGESGDGSAQHATQRNTHRVKGSIQICKEEKRRETWGLKAAYLRSE